LQIAFQMYVGDFGDKLPYNQDYDDAAPNGGGPTPLEKGTAVWCYGGDMDWNVSNGANSNYNNLINPGISSLASYVSRQYQIYVCPSDTFLSAPQRAKGWANRCRSITMDASVGGGTKWQGFVTMWDNYQDVKNMSAFRFPGPAQSWVFMDEHPDALDDVQLYVKTDDPTRLKGQGGFTELPASYHNQACGLSFADGHAEIHKWLDPDTVVPVKAIAPDYTTGRRPSGPNVVRDLIWLSNRTPRARQ
jgi:prepilin-type processing-associated H-X9-DG protein